MAAQFPRVRNACENCHRKKIRCFLAVDDGACQNCAASGSLCLFAPRVKTGRPRRGTKESHGTIQEEATRTSTQPQAESYHSGHVNTPVHYPSSSSHEEETIEDYFGCGKAPFLHNSHGMQYTSPTEQKQTQILFPSRASVTPNSTTRDHMIGLMTPLIATPSSSTSTSAIPLDVFENTDTPGGSNFNVFLNLCAELDRHCNTMREQGNNLDNIQTIVGSVDAACTKAMKADTCNGASTALMIAALLKTFEICEAVLQNTPARPSMGEATMLDHILLLKRLDLVLLQAKIFLTRIGQLEVAKKATNMHYWLESSLKKSEGHWIWSTDDAHENYAFHSAIESGLS